MVKELEEIGVIQKSSFEVGHFMNNVFLREKRTFCKSLGNKYRMILNFKELNRSVGHVHFKLDN